MLDKLDAYRFINLAARQLCNWMTKALECREKLMVPEENNRMRQFLEYGP